ncbi:hypothetical protein HW555_012403, partial [Spodoptera exigua]
RADLLQTLEEKHKQNHVDIKSNKPAQNQTKKPKSSSITCTSTQQTSVLLSTTLVDVLGSDGTDDESTLLEIATGVNTELKKYQFPLRKWKTNCPAVLRKLGFDNDSKDTTPARNMQTILTRVRHSEAVPSIANSEGCTTSQRSSSVVTNRRVSAIAQRRPWNIMILIIVTENTDVFSKKDAMNLPPPPVPMSYIELINVQNPESEHGMY